MNTLLKLYHELTEPWSSSWASIYSAWNKRSDNVYELSLELPGFKSSDVRVELSDGAIFITASKNKQCLYSYTTLLPQRYVENSIKAKVEDGVLTLTIETEPIKRKQITVE